MSAVRFVLCVEGGDVATFDDGAEALARAVEIHTKGWEDYGIPEVTSIVVVTDEGDAGREVVEPE